mgnify:CR=1 FL=1
MKADKFFDEQLKEIKLDSRDALATVARKLERDIQRQIERNFKNASVAFKRGVKVHDYENASYVRLSPILSSHAQKLKIEGNPNLWILLPQGKKLGFKRFGAGGFNWAILKRRYGTKLSFVSVDDGQVVLYRYKGQVVPVYKIQQLVQTEQRIKFFEAAEKLASKYNVTE